MKIPVILLLFFLTAGPAFGQSNDCAELSVEALQLSGFNADIEQQAADANDPDYVQSAIRSWQLAPGSEAVVQEALRKGFDPVAVQSELAKLVSTGCQTGQMTLVVQQLRLPLLMRIVAVENAAKSSQGRKELNDYLTQHAGEWTSLPRMAALQKLDTRLGYADFTTKNSLAAQSGMADGLGIRGAKNMKSVYVSDFAKAQISGTHLQILSAMYRSVSDDDLKEYVQVLTSEPMRAFYLLVMRSLLTVDEQRGRIIGEEIKKNLPPGSINPGNISLGARGKQH